ncbi:MAG: phosphatase PAP2 family protein, partial [Bariatricus sp.]
TASFQFHRLLPNHKLLLRALDTFCIFLPLITILGRLISGVHWFTDILSGLLLSAALVSLYYALINLINQ